MSDNVEKIIQSAASNVACESKEEVSQETLEVIKKQLLGLSKQSDESFIYDLYKTVVAERDEGNNGKTHVRK